MITVGGLHDHQWGCGAGRAALTSRTDGVLEVRVRKPEEAKPRRIEIGVNGKSIGGSDSGSTIEGTAEEA